MSKYDLIERFKDWSNTCYFFDIHSNQTDDSSITLIAQVHFDLVCPKLCLAKFSISNILCQKGKAVDSKKIYIGSRKSRFFEDLNQGCSLNNLIQDYRSFILYFYLVGNEHFDFIGNWEWLGGCSAWDQHFFPQSCFWLSELLTSLCQERSLLPLSF